MSNIESNKGVNSDVNLLQNIPQTILSKISSNLGNFSDENQEIEVTIISNSNSVVLKEAITNVGGQYEDLGYGFGLVKIKVKDIKELAKISMIQYIELPKELYTTDVDSNRAACVSQAQSTYSTYGRGVLVGFIDSGIDYTHRAFRNADGTTRIKYIYDLSEGGEIYDSAKINEALNSRDPYSVVGVVDVTKHGTHVAGIACAGGAINKKFYGVAPESSIAMVKATRGAFTLSTQIMKGLRFLVNKSKELKMPLVVNISLSTNDGAHNGTSLLEQYINTVATLERITIVIAAGNEGEAAHHVGGELDGDKEVFINVSSDEPSVVLNIYKSIFPNITVQITSPTGAVSQEVYIDEGYKEGRIGNDKYKIYVTGPKPFDIDGEILIYLSAGNKYLVEGRWKLNIKVQDENKGRFDIWLPVAEGLNKNTKFFEPTVLNTLGIPATVKSVISVGSYNYVTNTISPFSGKGVPSIYTPIKPDLVAPGENIFSTAPNNGFDKKSGTSMAAPHVTGICALLLEWGIVKGNDPYLYGERLKYFLVNGAKRERRDISYPNPYWGYGTVCAYNTFEFLSNTIKGILRDNSDFRLESVESLKDTLDKSYKDILASSNEKVTILVEFSTVADRIAFENLKIAEVIQLDPRFALVRIEFDKINKLVPYISEINTSVIPDLYTLEAISPVETSGANLFHNGPYLSLTGKGIVVGIIDTGIDYLNSEFMREDDTTRIVSIWDQTIESDTLIYDTKIGEEYTEEQINMAIQAKLKNEDPYAIVPSRDTNGHGTMVAGLIGARGNNPEIIGAAPDCQFIIVKLNQVGEIIKDFAGVYKDKECYASSEIVLAMRYIIKKTEELQKPLVIFIPLGSNIGSHDGKAFIESYIDSISSRVGVSVVTGSGNQGDTDTHTEGRIDNQGDRKTIELKIGPMQKNLNFQIWCQQPDKVSISIVSPSGEVIEKIPAKLSKVEDVKFVYEGTQMRISYQIPEIVTGDELINIEARNIKAGIWQFILIGDHIIDGRYWSWIPQRELLDPDTKFLSPSQYTTLTIPGTSRKAIVGAFYNQSNLATVGKSGRGYTRDGRIEPEIAAGGIDAKVLLPGGGIGVASGSSVGSAVLTGCIALIMQWGIVDKNDVELYPTKIRSYLIRGAKTRSGETYPNREWGYGILSMQGVFDQIRSGNIEKITRYREYQKKNLFIRRPN